MNKFKSTIALLTLVTGLSFAGNDPSIKGVERMEVAKAMKEHIDSHKVDGKYLIYDGASNVMRSLTLTALHDGIVKKGDFYVSCADFKDEKGNELDLDFLVINDGKDYKFVQSLVHKVGGEKRPYTLE